MRTVLFSKIMIINKELDVRTRGKQVVRYLKVQRQNTCNKPKQEAKLAGMNQGKNTEK